VCEELKGNEAYAMTKRRKGESIKQESFFIWISALRFSMKDYNDALNPYTHEPRDGAESL
jgi:hypothetical protein